MRLLMVCLSDPGGGEKGDTKLVRKRQEVLEEMGCTVDILYFGWGLRKSSIVLNQREARKGLDIALIMTPLKLVMMAGRTLKRIRSVPIQTIYSFTVAHVWRKELLNIFTGYSAIHYFHIRSAGLWKLAQKKAQVVVDLIDSYTLNMSSRLKIERSIVSRYLLNEELSRIRKMEGNISRYVSSPAQTTVVTVAEEDMGYINTEYMKKLVVPVGIYCKELRRLPDVLGRFECIFFGNLDYAPNVTACKIIREAADLVNARGQTAKIGFTVAGRNISRRMREHLRSGGISVISPALDMQELVQRHHIAVLPMVTGSGMQSKVLEAISWGVPVMTTEKAARPVGLTRSRDYIEISSASDLVDRLLEVKDRYSELGAMRVSAHKKIQRFEWRETCKALLKQYVDE